jgi:hypothetical protein
MRMLFLLGILVFLVACTQHEISCTEPYIVNGNTCCLDKDANAVCDVDELEGGETLTPSEDVCELCPPKFVSELREIEVLRYVCTNGTIVDTPDECAFVLRSNAVEFSVNKEQNDEYVDSFRATPACRGLYSSAEVHTVLYKNPQTFVLQAKSSPTGGFTDLLSIESTERQLDETYLYVGFCDPFECNQLTDVQLAEDSAHVLRVKLIYADETVEYTRERLVDPVESGDIGQLDC